MATKGNLTGMKKYTLFISLFIASSLFCQNDSVSHVLQQSQSVDNIEQSATLSIINGIKDVLSLVNYSFLIILLTCASFLNEAVEAENWAKSLSVLKAMPRGLRTLILGVFFMFLFVWAYRINSRVQIFGMILTIFASMILLSIGLNKIIRFVSHRIGLKFDAAK